MDLALNNLQRLICHKTHQTKPNQTAIQFAIGRKYYYDSLFFSHVRPESECVEPVEFRCVFSIWRDGYPGEHFSLGYWK